MSKKYKTKSRFDFNHSRDGKDYIRKSLFDYGTQIVTTDRMEYEVEFLSEERTLGYSRMLWCRSLWIDNKDDLGGQFYILDEDVDIVKKMKQMKN